MYVKTGKVVQVFRHFPLDIHPNAPAASQASICAGEQDVKFFWEMHDWLFEMQGSWQSASDAAAQFRTQALAIGVDGGKYDACIANPATAAAVQKDLQEGSSLGVRGTPAFFLYKMQGGEPVGDPRPLSGALPFAQFSQVIDALLAQ
jgi:protein-disulfide isomerase